MRSYREEALDFLALESSKEEKEETLSNLLSSSSISLRFQPLLKVSYFISEQSKRARRSEVKLQVRFVNGE